MGGAISLWMIGLADLLIVGLILGLTAYVNRQSKKRLMISIGLMAAMLTMLVFGSQFTHTTREWIYDPITSLLYAF